MSNLNENNNEVNAINDNSNLKINISIEKPEQKPMNITIPFAMIKRFAKIGNEISGVMGNGSLDGIKLDEILELVENGATGEILSVSAEDDSVISITVI